MPFLTHRYAYDALNRLRTLSVGYGTTTLHGYEYKLRTSGHRYQIVEATGRTATYAYDALYRLTGETIAGDPAGQNGTVTYGLDSVGNRLTRTSSVPSVSSTVNTFNARDWLTSDAYDANGNTTAGLNALGERSATGIYDFENRLILRLQSDGTQLSLSYDADGNRIQKTRFDASARPASTTTYLVDTNNTTGYAQVVEEHSTSLGNPASETVRTYTYGADLISCAEVVDAQPATIRYYLYDGLGSVRALSDESGALTDTYGYDAFGNLIARTGSTDNAYLYRGEQGDADLGLYYNRARYLNSDSGRFWSMDSYEGSPSAPASLHKYLYANANPVSQLDPSGHTTLMEMSAVGSVMSILANVQGGIGLALADQIIYGGNAGNLSIATQAAFGTAFIVAGRVIKLTWRFSAETTALIERAFPGGVMALRAVSTRAGRPVGVYKALAGKLGSGLERNHLNVAAVFKRIPHGEGLVVALQGRVSQAGSEHWSFHSSLDQWADRIIKGQGRKPTVGEYFSEGLPAALMNTELDPYAALVLAEAAERQASHYGYTADMLLDWIPSTAVRR